VAPAQTVEVPLESAPPPSKPATAETPEKKGLVQRLNPLGWFGKDDKPSAAEAKPARAQASPSRPAGSVTVGPTSATPPPAVRPFSRYRYRHPAKPTPGNTSEALRLVTVGAQAQQANRLADAIQNYQKGAEADPACFEAHYNLGVAAYEAGYWDLALTSGEKALSLRPQDTQARFNFALVLQRADYPEDAANEYEIILRARPNDTSTWYALGNLYANRLSDPAKARDCYRKVLELDPRYPQARFIQDWLDAHP
jgi:tetratricopeptide (TPR) repeat protein